MTRPSEIKKMQGFTKDAPACRNCEYHREGVCCIGGFKVNKTNSCKKHYRI